MLLKARDHQGPDSYLPSPKNRRVSANLLHVKCLIELQTVSLWLLSRPLDLCLTWRLPSTGWRSSSTTSSSTAGSPNRRRPQTSFSMLSSRPRRLCLNYSEGPVQVDLPGDGQHGHAHPPDHEPGPEAGQCRPSLSVPGGQQEQSAVRQVIISSSSRE